MENNQVVETKDNQTSVESFDKIINESKIQLQNETSQQVKRGRGRPKGSPNTKGRENEPLNPSNSAHNETPTLEAGQAQVLPSLDLQPVLKDVTKLPFTIASIKYKMPELEITDVEADTPTFYLNKVLNNYMPELERKNPKAFAFYAWLISIALLGIKKMIAAVENKKNNLTTVKPAPNNNSDASNDQLAPVPVQATHGTDASSFFNYPKF